MAEPDRTNADAERVSDIVAELRDLCRDWTGEPIVDGSTPRYEPHVGLLRRAADALAASMWQPISTAPHDGTHLQVRDATQLSMPPFTAHWFDGAFHLSVNFDGEHSSHGCGSLTHWRPLEPAAADIIEAQSKALAEARVVLVYAREHLIFDPESGEAIDVLAGPNNIGEQIGNCLRGLTPTPENPNG